jgi:hypothetical protein
MTLEDKIGHATALIRHFPGPYALMCSFGKDSMVLLHLIRDLLPGAELRAHQYPIPVIYHRTPWFPAKQEFADGVIRSWNLEVHDYPPLACGIKCNEERLELVAKYPFGDSGLVMSLNTEQPLARRDFVCGLEWLKWPKSYGMEWPWATVFIGHKDCDVDPYLGPVPLEHDAADGGGVNIVFPLRHWTHDDIWEYTEKNHVPYDKRRYVARLSNPDTWLNPDYIHACTKCIDPREEATEVMCPKLKKMVPNLSGKVLRLDELPPYIKRSEEQAV